MKKKKRFLATTIHFKVLLLAVKNSVELIGYQASLSKLKSQYYISKVYLSLFQLKLSSPRASLKVLSTFRG